VSAAFERIAERLPAVLIDTFREQWSRIVALVHQINEIERRLQA
jgi:hypothetical protein